MKKLLLILSLCLFAFSTKAQDLNFEETVLYIQNNIKDLKIVKGERANGSSQTTSSITLKNIQTFKNGNVIFNFADEIREKWKFNLLDLSNNKEFMRVSNSSLNFLFESDYRRKYFSIETDSDVAAIRLERAFRNLLKVCIKQKDPFDQ